MQTKMLILWGVLTVLFIIIEAVSVQLISIWFALGSLAGLIAAICGATPVVQSVVFISVTVLALAATRPLVKKLTKKTMQKTNADRNVGANGVVLETIDNLNAQGQVKVNGNVWTARSTDGSVIEKDETVLVERIDGVKLMVKKQ